MKLIEVSVESINKSCRYRRGFILDMIEEFLHSGMKAAEIEWKDHYSNVKSAYGTIYKSALRSDRLVKIMLDSKNGKIYIIRKEDEDA